MMNEWERKWIIINRKFVFWSRLKSLAVPLYVSCEAITAKQVALFEKHLFTLA